MINGSGDHPSVDTDEREFVKRLVLAAKKFNGDRVIFYF